MIWRVVEHVDASHPAVAVGDAERDPTLRAQAGCHCVEKGLGVRLVFEHLEKGDDVKFLRRIASRELTDGERQYAPEAKALLGKPRGVSIQFDPADGVARIPRGDEKVSCAAAYVQEFPLRGSVFIRKKIVVPRLKRHKSGIARGIHAFIPESVGHFTGIPERKIAVRAVKQTEPAELFDEREVTQPAASGADRGYGGLRAGLSEWNMAGGSFAELLAGLHQKCAAARRASREATPSSRLALRHLIHRACAERQTGPEPAIAYNRVSPRSQNRVTKKNVAAR